MTVKQWIKQYGGLFILAVCVILFYKFFDSFHVIIDLLLLVLNVLTPFIVGAVLAYLLNPIKKWVQKYLEKSNHSWVKDRTHSLSVIIVYFSFLLMIVIGLIYLIPTVVRSVTYLLEQIPTYVTSFESWLFSVVPEQYHQEVETTYLHLLKISGNLSSFFERILQFNLTKYVLGAVNITTKVFSWLMGLIICPYILFEINHLTHLLNRFLNLFLEEDKITFLRDYTYKINKIFLDFIIGKGIDSIIIGIIAFIFFSIMDYPFAGILAMVILITNMIPYFGPFIGGIPVAFFILISSGFMPFVWAGVFIFVLQQFDGLILGPAILGDSVGISAFWIIFAITFFGGLFGFIGMFIGVPLICVIRMMFNDYCAYHKKKIALKKNRDLQM